MVAFIFSAAILIAVANTLALTLHREMLSVRAPFTNTDECPFFFLELVLEIWDSDLTDDQCILWLNGFKGYQTADQWF